MKSRPIIMQGFSISAIKDGRKVETRRTRGLDKINENPNDWRLMTHSKPFDIKPDEYFFVKNEPYTEVLIKCPYGKIGDEIWVKESYKPLVTGGPKGFNLYDYKADVGSKGMADDIINGWKSPMFMPKAASRIKLEITGLSIERLHDITEEGALREGITVTKLPAALGGGMAYNIKGKYISALDIEDSATGAYKWIWINMHGQESWNKSPWVWVIQFTVKEFKQ